MNLTGQDINYYYICHRKLWLYRHGVRPELENDNVQIGMHIQEKSFSRQKKEIPIGIEGVLDWADFADGIIHETKKGRSPHAADEAQVRYYMFVLNKNGVVVREAEIHYPLLRKTKRILWDEAAEKQTEKDINETESIISHDCPPSRLESGICRKCEYEEICYT